MQKKVVVTIAGISIGVAMLSSSVIVQNAEAKHLGKYGSSFQIEEPDFLTSVETKLRHLEASGEIAKINNEYQDKIKLAIQRPPAVNGIKKATTTKSRKYNPTQYLEEDITTTNSNNQEKILYTRGTAVNPLDYSPFENSLLFIDGDDRAQEEYARSMRKQDALLIIILVNGKPGLKEEQGEEYYYYFDQAGVYSRRFDIKKVPSLVYQDGREKLFTIKEVALQ